MLKRAGIGAMLATGLVSAAAAQLPTKFDGQYVGELTLTGIISGDCTKPPVGAAYPLTIAGGQVSFKYVPRFDTTLRGRIDANGSFKAGGSTKHGFVTMTGQVSGYRNLTADIISPSCQYRFKSKN